MGIGYNGFTGPEPSDDVTSINGTERKGERNNLRCLFYVSVSLRTHFTSKNKSLSQKHGTRTLIKLGKIGFTLSLSEL